MAGIEAIITFLDAQGHPLEVSAANPLPSTGSGGGGGDVNLTEVAGVAIALGQAAAAASVPVVLASDQGAVTVQGDAAHDAPAAGNPVLIGGIARSSQPAAVTNGDAVAPYYELTGEQHVIINTLLDTQDQIAVGVNAAVTGLSTYRNVSVTGAASAKAGAGRLHGWHIANDSGADAYVHIYNKASGSVTVGTDTPALTLKAPAGGILDQPAGFPFAFSTAISVAAAAAATGAGLAAAGVIVNLYYI